MTLIADGGSTKCDWILLNSKGEVELKTQTLGLNPTVVSAQVLAERLQGSVELKKIKNKVKTIHFYGAGCGTDTAKHTLEQVLKSNFTGTAAIKVEEDLAAAVYAVTTKPGIVCILGTGSNSCYFDGDDIFTNAPSLGYTLMDEASGNYFGKRLLRDYFYNTMPKHLQIEFANCFKLDIDVVKHQLYQTESPNMYLASFAEFIFKRDDAQLNPYFYKLIEEGIVEFIKYRIVSFKESQHCPIHFIGSIAYFSQSIIRDCFKQYNLTLGTIIRRPIDGLVTYYKQHILQ